MKNKKNAVLITTLIAIISLASTATFAKGNKGSASYGDKGKVQCQQKGAGFSCDRSQKGDFGKQKNANSSMGSKMHKARKNGGRDKMRKYHAEFRTWLETNYPEEFKSISDSKNRSDMQAVTRKYMPIFMAQKKGHNDMAELLKKDLELKDQRDALVKEIDTTDNSTAKAALIQELSNIVSKRFDIVLAKKKIRFNNLKKRIAELEKEVEKQEDALNKLESDKNIQVKQRIKELLEPQVTLEW